MICNVAARVLATYLIPGCVGRGVRLGSENSSGGAGAGAAGGVWAQARAQARFLEFWKSGTWKSGNLGSQKIQKIKIFEIQIRSAQNVGKVWISRKKNLPAAFGALWAQFLRGPEKSKKSYFFAYFPWWAYWYSDPAPFVSHASSRWANSRWATTRWDRQATSVCHRLVGHHSVGHHSVGHHSVGHHILCSSRAKILKTLLRQGSSRSKILKCPKS